MERDISKPNVVKGIPVPLIRPLPTLYYYGQYFQQNDSPKAIKLFKDHIEYLTDAIKILASEVDDDINYIANLTSELSDTDTNIIVNKVIQITSKLSDACIKHKNKIKDNPKFSKENLAQLYRLKVQPLKLLLIDNNNEPQRAKKLLDTFQNTCYYDVTATAEIYT